MDFTYDGIITFSQSLEAYVLSFSKNHLEKFLFCFKT